MQKLSDLDKHIVATILGAGNRASGYDIRAILKEKAGRDVSVGALYTTLERLKSKGFLEYEVADGGEDRGGRPQRFFSVNALGQSALDAAFAADQAIYGFARLLPNGVFA